MSKTNCKWHGCPYTAANERDLRQHENTHHIRCPCGKCYTMPALMRHLARCPTAIARITKPREQ